MKNILFILAFISFEITMKVSAWNADKFDENPQIVIDYPESLVKELPSKFLI